jgi:hypothetical protein
MDAGLELGEVASGLRRYWIKEKCGWYEVDRSVVSFQAEAGRAIGLWLLSFH